MKLHFWKWLLKIGSQKESNWGRKVTILPNQPFNSKYEFLVLKKGNIPLTVSDQCNGVHKLKPFQPCLNDPDMVIARSLAAVMERPPDSPNLTDTSNSNSDSSDVSWIYDDRKSRWILFAKNSFEGFLLCLWFPSNQAESDSYDSETGGPPGLLPAGHVDDSELSEVSMFGGWVEGVHP